MSSECKAPFLGISAFCLYNRNHIPVRFLLFINMKSSFALRISIAAVLFVAVTVPMVIAATTPASSGEAFKEERKAIRLQQTQEASAVSAPQSNAASTGIDYKAARSKLTAQREKDQALTTTAIANAQISCRQRHSCGFRFLGDLRNAPHSLPPAETPETRNASGRDRNVSP